MISPRSSAATSLKLGRLALIGASAALLAVACSIGNVDDNEPGIGNPTGGQAGEGGGATGGSDTGGTGGTGATGGTTETGGQGGEATGGAGTGGDGTGGVSADLDCDATVDGTPASTEADPNNPDECTECAKELCANEFADCFAEGPDHACGWGEDGTNDTGEFAAMLGCLDGRVESGDFVGDDTDVDECAADASVPVAACDSDEASSVTQDLARCVLGTTGGAGCQAECGFL